MCIVIYGYNDKDGRQSLGDFVVVANMTERISSSPPCLGSIADFASFLTNLSLFDVSASHAQFTR